MACKYVVIMFLQRVFKKETASMNNIATVRWFVYSIKVLLKLSLLRFRKIVSIQQQSKQRTLVFFFFHVEFFNFRDGLSSDTHIHMVCL